MVVRFSFQVIRFHTSFPPGENGVSEPSLGTMLVDNDIAHQFELYNPDFSLVAALAHACAVPRVLE